MIRPRESKIKKKILIHLAYQNLFMHFGESKIRKSKLIDSVRALVSINIKNSKISHLIVISIVSFSKPLTNADK